MPMTPPETPLGAELDRWEDAERGLFQRLLLLRPADAHR